MSAKQFFVTVVAAFTIAPPVAAQPSPEGLWKPAEGDVISRLRTTAADAPASWNRTTPARYFRLDRKLLGDVLGRAPMEAAAVAPADARPRPSRSEIAVPMPDGSLARF